MDRGVTAVEGSTHGIGIGRVADRVLGRFDLERPEGRGDSCGRPHQQVHVVPSCRHGPHGMRAYEAGAASDQHAHRASLAERA
jgi:hypothetical protein